MTNTSLEKLQQRRTVAWRILKEVQERAFDQEKYGLEDKMEEISEIICWIEELDVMITRLTVK